MLKKGDIIDIVFPSTCLDKEAILQVKNYLKNRNFTPRILFEKETTPKKNLNCNLPCASANARFKQLYEALKNPQSKLVWCARGGYGSADLLPLLEKSQPIKQNKLFIGFSDITSIANFLQEKWGWKILYAPMLVQLIENGKLKVSKKSEKEIWDLILEKKSVLEYNLIALNKAKNNIESEIVGGCLSVLCGNFGGNSQLNFADKILFLEDIDESGEKLDRYFFQIIQTILKTKQKPAAILLGEFDCGIKDKFTKQNISESLKRLISRIEEHNLQIPVFQTKEKLGHSDKMSPLVLGTKSLIKIASKQNKIDIKLLNFSLN